MAKGKKNAPKATKTAPAPASTPAKKNPARRLAANRQRRHARRAAPVARRNPSSNPPGMSDLTHVLLPGFGAFAATRVISRIAFSLVERRWPGWGKHAAAGAGLLTAGAAWGVTHRIAALEPYHDGVVMGSSFAALHTAAVAWLPLKYNFLMADAKPSDVAPAATASSTAIPASTAADPSQLSTAGDEYSFLEEQAAEVERSGSKRVRYATPGKPSAKPVAAALRHAAGADDDINLDPDLSSELGPGEDIDDLFTGSFAPN